MKPNTLAKDLFKEYRTLAERGTENYVKLKVAFPLAGFPRHGAAIWRLGMLAEIWGTIATRLGRGKVNYLGKWATGGKDGA